MPFRDLVTYQAVLYEVTLQVEPDLAPAVEHYMRTHHIPVILRTRCFYNIRFDRADDGKFRTSYRAHSSAELERYLQDHAPALRAEFQAEFPSGVALTRETWTARQEWQTE
ncbi:MAG: DUF4286 family protein [Gemmatimonadales bacterium]